MADEVWQAECGDDGLQVRLDALRQCLEALPSRSRAILQLKPATVAKRYRLELSTAERIATGGTTKTVKRSFAKCW